MNYEYYKIFYYVGKHKNISRAATEMHSSQPAVSRVIQSLENELGCRLFVRTKSGVEFTNEGKTLFGYVQIAQSHISKGEEELNRSVNAESGTIHIGATVASLYGFLYDVLDEFRSLHPKVKIKINTGSNNGTIEKLRNGIYDIAFVSTPCKIYKELNSYLVRTFNDILIGGNNYSELKDRVLPLRELCNYPFVSLRPNMQLREFIDEFLIENYINVSPDVEADNVGLLPQFIANNCGLGYVPEDMAQPLIERNEIFRIHTEKELPPRYIYMVTDPHHPHTNASRELARMIIKNHVEEKTDGKKLRQSTDNRP